MKVAPSILAADFSRLAEEIRQVEKAGADLIHLDIMDGVFVPNLTFGPVIVEAIKKIADRELDAHLMIINPEKYLDRYLNAGCDWISIHFESTDQTDQCLQRIRAAGKKAGLAISPPTPFVYVESYLPRLDYLLIMSVNPGFYGQAFLAETLPKIAEARTAITRQRLPCLIQVDGGIYGHNARAVRDAGADIVVAGAGIFKNPDYQRAIAELRCSKD